MSWHRTGPVPNLRNGLVWFPGVPAGRRCINGDGFAVPKIHVGAEAGKTDPKAPAATSFDDAGFAVAAMPWKASGKPAIASVFLHTDLHPKKSDGRRLLGTMPLTGSKK